MALLPNLLPALGITVGAAAILSSTKLIDEEHKGLKEDWNAYSNFLEPGLHFKIPVKQRIRTVKVAEQSVNISPSDMITKDNLNAEVDLVVYFQVRSDEESVKSAKYEADDYERQIVSLARTTARNVIGDMKFEEVNSQRSKLNNKLQEELDEETDKWGIDVVRVEMEEISPPDDVQDSMNEILKAENTKEASRDKADAMEIEAEGEKKAYIQQAKGKKKAQILQAQGKAKQIETVADAKAKKIKVENLALQEYFEGSAKTFEELQVTQNSLKNGSKYVIDSDSDPTLVLSNEMDNITPISQDEGLSDEDSEFLKKRISNVDDIDSDVGDLDDVKEMEDRVEEIKEKAEENVEEQVDEEVNE